ncbi:cysteine synthase A [Haloimpatiens sp. FM7315]|uniref:cysteine synthase A n=1 Tax=Haloimpatiens sp. FM7315 TaxID=3298609 RepID=UPI0035A276A1
MNIYKSALDLVGNTPLLELSNLKDKYKLNCSLLGKVEYFNPGGSVKDRVALSMIEDAENKGLIKKGDTIIEPTSGNTGIGLAFVSAIKGYKLILTMPESMSIERRKLLKAYGATLVLTEARKGMRGAIEKAEELKSNIENSFIPQQFGNLANPKAHIKTTGEEIWRDTEGKVDIFVACVGTGGTITGVGKALKEKNPSVKIVAIEPSKSAVLSGEKPGSHNIQGIGAGFVPDILDTNIIDEVIKVSDEDAFKITKELPLLDGILVGISSGAALYGAIELGNREENKGKNIVVLLPDTGERYLSTPIFD